MPILVVGSIALDTIQSPYGRVERSLGGSATFFALSASYFTQVRMIGVVGEDFTAADEETLRKRGVETHGIERAPGKTFHWSGEYGQNPNDCKMHELHLNVFERFQPKIPADYLNSDYLFLANIDPVLQAKVHSQMRSAKLVGLDTHPFWIQTAPEQLRAAIKDVDVMIINDGEAREFAGEHNLLRAAHRILVMGPKSLVIKHGEYGATIFFRESQTGYGKHPFRAPALPLNEVRDPTGAGDAFAGGFMGYIASSGNLTPEVLRRAMFYGGVMGGFAVERFGAERLLSLTREEIDERFEILRQMTHLE
jgi:sugar/nucleoside kinase (ribokinase family)